MAIQTPICTGTSPIVLLLQTTNTSQLSLGPLGRDGGGGQRRRQRGRGRHGSTTGAGSPTADIRSPTPATTTTNAFSGRNRRSLATPAAEHHLLGAAGPTGPEAGGGTVSGSSYIWMLDGTVFVDLRIKMPFLC